MSDNAGRSYLVVVGSSAGGIDALSTLLATLPADFPAPVVIAQHLDPRRESHLAEILARQSALPIRTATRETALEPGIVSVVPANQQVEIQPGTLLLTEASEERPVPSIDRLFTSAAAAYGERLIAVILSGTGSDGAAGAQAVKQAGGTVLCENPATARFPGMPLALAPLTVDLVAELEQLGPILAELVTGQRVLIPRDPQPALTHFLNLLRDRYRLDFTQYKLPTIQRRLQRRLVATHSPTLAAYATYLETHPEEVHALTTSFLINVTEFFRDPALFTLLQQRVLPALIARAKQEGAPLRVWSAGCATGEEAYSLGILLAEALGEELARWDVRIFATDVDAEAVEFARHARYPASALTHVPAQLVERYFTPENGQFQLVKGVRVLTVFGLHDLGQSAPFRQIDLILCRNVLIYFTPELQQRALALFAYALRDGGHLVLGQSESMGALAPYFAPVDPTLKLYRRQGERLVIPPARVLTLEARIPERSQTAPPTPPSLTGLPHLPPERTPRSLAEDVVQALPDGVVVVDRHYDIQLLNRAARTLLAIHRVALGEDLIHLLPASLVQPVRTLIDQAFRTPHAPVRTEIAVEEAHSGQPRSLSLRALSQPRTAGRERPNLVLMVIQDVTELTQTRRALEHRLQEAVAAVAEREQQLAEVRETNRQLSETNYDLTSGVEDLQATAQQLQVRAEEAQAVTEEAETLNEELQSTNEEFETLNEELQSTNEELQATNEELQARSQELQRVNEERETERVRVSALLHSLADAVALIGPDGQVVLSNAAFRALVGDEAALMVAGDASGQPMPEVSGPLGRAARGEAFTLAFTLPGPEGAFRWFEARGQPIRDAAGQPLGGVLVLHHRETAPT